MKLYPYTAPTGMGMARQEKHAIKLNELFDQYSVACKADDKVAQKRIRREEDAILAEMKADGQYQTKQDAQALPYRIYPEPLPDHPPSPRFMRITAYVKLERGNDRGGVGTYTHDWSVYLDTYEIEAIAQDLSEGWAFGKIYMRSGQVWEVSALDLERIEQALRERNKP